MQGWTIKSLLCGFVLATGVASNPAHADIAHFHFVGTISGPTCSLQTSDITLPIGVVDRTTFTGVGSASPWSPTVSLVSAGCNASLVSMTFSGTADASNPHLFAVTGGAAGVGIQLANGDHSVLATPNDVNKPMTFAPAGAGQGYSFAARYVQTTDAVTPGNGDATITVLITYI
jgi:major type 1 subunit fimbrin (pilin)